MSRFQLRRTFFVPENTKFELFDFSQEHYVIFPQYENFQNYMVQVLFFMKYFGHFSFAEVYSLPVFYRNKMLEMLQERLERENGQEKDVEKTDGVDLNESQRMFLSDPNKLQQLLAQSSVHNIVSDNESLIKSSGINFKSILKK